MHSEAALAAEHADAAPSSPLDATSYDEHADDEGSIPGSPAFDDSFAAEAQFILGCLVTPAPSRIYRASSTPGARPLAPAALEGTMQVH
jgi:hypothetical protein